MQSNVANAIRGIGVIEIVAGIILGGFLGYDYEMNWAVFFLWSGAGFVSGIMFIGFAEIIELLHSINSKLKGTKTIEDNENMSVDNNTAKKKGKYEMLKELQSESGK